ARDARFYRAGILSPVSSVRTLRVVLFSVVSSTGTADSHTLSLHDALPIFGHGGAGAGAGGLPRRAFHPTHPDAALSLRRGDPRRQSGGGHFGARGTAVAHVF